MDENTKRFTLVCMGVVGASGTDICPIRMMQHCVGIGRTDARQQHAGFMGIKAMTEEWCRLRKAV